MFTNDYIMRQIEMLVLGLARIVGLKQENRFEESAELLSETLRKFFGLNDRAVETLPWRDLMAVASLGEALDAERCALLAQLVKEKADAEAHRSGLPQEALYEKALDLYLHAYLSDESIRMPGHAECIDELLPLAAGAEKEQEALSMRLRYEEGRGRFARAEDRLYEWLTASGRAADAMEQGIAFYKRLLERKDGELEQGGLPRAEVEDGLERLKASSRSIEISQ